MTSSCREKEAEQMQMVKMLSSRKLAPIEVCVCVTNFWSVPSL